MATAGPCTTHRPSAIVRAVLALALLVVTLALGGHRVLAAPSDTTSPPDENDSGPASVDVEQNEETTAPTSNGSTDGEPEGADDEPALESEDSGESGDEAEVGDEASVANETSDVRPGRSARVADSDIAVGSIALAVAVLVAMGVGARRISRGQRTRPPGPNPPLTLQQELTPDDIWEDQSAEAHHLATLHYLLELGEALIDSGIAVPQVNATLDSVAATYGIDRLGAQVLPTSLILSVPTLRQVHTEVSQAGTTALRLDQMDAVTNLVSESKRGALTAAEARDELARIRSTSAPFAPRLMVSGYVLATIGLVLVLGGAWRDVLLGGLLGAAVGALLVSTRRVENIAFVPFQPLIAATVASVVVFATSHVVAGLIIFPVLVAPLVTLLPGAKLTIGVLELATGHIVAGTTRVAAGAMQLVLLGLGIAAGAELIGVGEGVRSTTATGPLAMIAPWVGIALFGIGVVWVYGAARSARIWILVMLFVAHAGQVIGALFFGPALSAFFGAFAMTPVAVLAARQPRGPSPLVAFLAGFWILVPGSLGLKAVSGLLGDSGATGATGADTIVTVLTSMVGIALGILVGLTTVARNPSRIWLGDDDDVVPRRADAPSARNEG